MYGRKEKNIWLTIFALIGIICAVASIAYAICNFFKKECEYDCDEFEFDDDDCCCDDDGCCEEEGCCDENGCAYTNEEDFEK